MSCGANHTAVLTSMIFGFILLFFVFQDYVIFLRTTSLFIDNAVAMSDFD